MRISTLFVAIVLIIGAAAAQSRPRRHLIPNVPYFRQVTEFACGDASLEMVMKFFDPRATINQKNIVNVARTSEEQGTSVQDVVRAARFSIMSSSATFRYPADALEGGYVGRSVGFPTYVYGHPVDPWVDELTDLVSKNIPVIVLQRWAVNDTDGHYRVVVGYDLDAKKIVMLDPWDREGAPRVLTVSTDVFVQLWNKTDDALSYFDEPNNMRFWGIAIIPFQLRVTGMNETTLVDSLLFKNITVSATYRCEAPFNCSDSSLALRSPQFRLDWGGVNPCDTTGACWIQSNVLQQRIFHQTPEASVLPSSQLAAPQSWLLFCDPSRPGSSKESCMHFFDSSWIRVSVYGLFSGSLPSVYCCGGAGEGSAPSFYPPYQYMDLVGEKLVLPLR